MEPSFENIAKARSLLDAQVSPAPRRRTLAVGEKTAPAALSMQDMLAAVGIELVVTEEIKDDRWFLFDPSTILYDGEKNEFVPNLRRS